jgi:hypothetical protein
MLKLLCWCNMFCFSCYWKNISWICNYCHWAWTFWIFITMSREYTCLVQNVKKKEYFEDTKGVIRSHKSTDRQCSYKKKRYGRANNDLQNTTQKIKDWTTRTHLNLEVNSCGLEELAVPDVPPLPLSIVETCIWHGIIAFYIYTDVCRLLDMYTIPHYSSSHCIAHVVWHRQQQDLRTIASVRDRGIQIPANDDLDFHQICSAYINGYSESLYCWIQTGWAKQWLEE